MRRLLVGIAIGLVGLAVIALMLRRPGVVLPNTGSALGSSLARKLLHEEFLSDAGAGCVRQSQRDWWLCDTSFDPGSGYSNPRKSFRLEAKWNGCWTARQLRFVRYAAVGVVGKTLSGCVSLADYVTPKDVPGGGPSPLEAPPP
jgi:hypothetical protein